MPLDPQEIQQILDTCSAALAGHSSEMQGAVLADLLSMWLAGHRVMNDPEATFKLREELLDAHMKAVVQLLRPNDEILNERYKTMMHPVPSPKDKPN